MTESERSPLFERLRLAWPEMTPERGRLYFEVLEELPASQVGAAVERLLRESSSTTLPPPGALRARALEVPEPPDPAPPATLRGSPVAPFNGMALAALLAGLAGASVFVALSGTGRIADHPPAIELLVLGGAGVFLGVKALGRARSGSRRNGTLSGVAIALSSLIVLLGLGSLGRIVQNARSGDSAAAGPLSAADADAAVKDAAEEWVTSGNALGQGYSEIRTQADLARWLRDSQTELGRMRTSVGTLQEAVASEPDPEVRAALAPLVASYQRQTNLATKLREDVAHGRVTGEERTYDLLQAAIARHAEIAATSQQKIDAID